MKLVKIKDLKGNEKLAKHIVTDMGMELMAKGTIIKPEYIEKLDELGIEYVFLDESNLLDIDFENEDQGIIHEKVKEESRAIVKDVLERHIYNNTGDLEKLCQAADMVIQDVLKEEEITKRVANIRRDGTDIYSHSINVCAMATVLALKNSLEDSIVKDVARGCILHDLGLRYVVTNYEDVDIDTLPAKEKSQFRKHVVLGYDAVKDEKWMSDIAKNIILFHHERNDGSGYPYKNHGDQIDDTVKIVEVCDTFDAMLNGIGYKQMKIHQVVEYLRDHSYITFDKKYVDQLLSMVALYPVGTKVIMGNGEIGVVVKQNKESIDRPVVKIISDKNGNAAKSERTIDMMEELTVFIVETMD